MKFKKIKADRLEEAKRNYEYFIKEYDSFRDNLNSLYNQIFKLYLEVEPDQKFYKEILEIYNSCWHLKFDELLKLHNIVSYMYQNQ